MTFGLFEGSVRVWALFPVPSVSWPCAGDRNVRWSFGLVGEVGASNAQVVPVVAGVWVHLRRAGGVAAGRQSRPFAGSRGPVVIGGSVHRRFLHLSRGSQL